MSFTRLFVRTSALAVSMLFIQSAMAGSIVGYSGDSSTDHPVVGSTPVTTSAADARTTFLTNLGNNYYYEDFQELTGFNKGGSLAFGGSYSLQWKQQGTPIAAAPAGTLSSPNTTDTHFRLGPVTNVRGAFDTFDSDSPGTGDLAAPIPGGTLADADNAYFDISPDKNADYNVTITLNPGQNAVGLMLNDVIQPSKTHVQVNFSDGTSDDLGALTSKGAAGKLTTDNVWFLGVIDNSATFISSVTITESSSGDPITLDNIYVGNVSPSYGSPVPLPASASAGIALIGLLAYRRRRDLQRMS